MASIDIRTENLTRLAAANKDRLPPSFRSILPQTPPSDQSPKLIHQQFSLDSHYQVAAGNSDWFHINSWLRENQEKEAIATKVYSLDYDVQN